MILSKNSQKAIQINDYLVTSGTGGAADVDMMQKIVRAELKLKELRSKTRPSVKEAANLISTIAYKGIRQFSTIPFIAGILVAGINDDGTAEGYAITIDCNQNPLTEVYEWLKYITRNGEVSTGSTDGIEGEQYEGATVYLKYSGTVSGGTIGEGEDVLQATSNATGIVISHDTANKQIVLRNTRGTFNTSNTAQPSMPGINTSRVIAAGCNSRAILIPISPEEAVTTRQPAFLR